VGILSRKTEGLGPEKPQQPVLPRDAGANSYPAVAGRDKIVCPARLLLSPTTRGNLSPCRWPPSGRYAPPVEFHDPTLEVPYVSDTFVRGLKCRLCGKVSPVSANNFCEDDFGPLEVDYDYDALAEAISKSKIEARPFTMWRYQEFLPLDGEPTVGLQVGGTPLLKADRLAAELGVENLWIKNDAVNFPTLSFKDRVVSVALSKAIEFGLETVGCASTGNLANSVAANAASAGLSAFIFVPSDLEKAKVLGTSVYGATVVGVRGTYDEVNRLCTQVAFKYGWGFVNINLRPFYAEGSKTFGFEMT